MKEIWKTLNFNSIGLYAKKFEDQYISSFGSHFSIKFDNDGGVILPLGLGVHHTTNNCLLIGVKIENKIWSLPLGYPSVFEKDFIKMENYQMIRTANRLKIKSDRYEKNLYLEWEFISPFYPQDKKISSAPFFYINISIRNDSTQQKEVKIIGGFELSNTNRKFINNKILTKDIRIAGFFRGPEYKQGKLLNSELGISTVEDNSYFMRLETTTAFWDCLAIDHVLKPKQCKTETYVLSCYNHDDNIITKHNEKYYFFYRNYFNSPESVISYAIKEKSKIMKKSNLFDEIFSNSQIPKDIKKFIYWNFHIFLGNTWLLSNKSKKMLYTNYENSAGYLSTVDFEYNLSPFYTLFWPDLLGSQLETWSEVYRKGNIKRPYKSGFKYKIMGHDIGGGFKIDEQIYIQGPMPIEENSNYLLMHYLYYIYTGDISIFKKFKEICIELKDYIIKSDTNGNGLPDLGTSNTFDCFEKIHRDIEDQVYLGIKSGSALLALDYLLKILNYNDNSILNSAKKIFNSIEKSAWKKDHYVITISENRINGWKNGTPLTTNGLTYLLLTGLKIPLDYERIKQDLLFSIKDYTIWPSMGIWRDINARYFGINLVKKYKFRPDFRNDFYSRSFCSVVMLQAYHGISINVAEKKIILNRLTDGSYPLVQFAEWEKGKIPHLKISNGKLEITDKTKSLEDIDIEFKNIY